MNVDFLIVGQGLAGSTLAMELRERGQRVLVVDRQDEGSSSRVAAGLITPLTGKGLNPAWRQDKYLPLASKFYRKLELESGEDFYHTTEVVRLLESEKELGKWRGKSEAHGRWGKEMDVNEDGILAEHGGVKMVNGAWLDTCKFLKVVKAILAAAGSYCEADFVEGHVVFGDDNVTWADVTARKIILCQGAYGLGNSGWFGELPHRSAKGEILTLKIENLPGDVRYHANGWLAARGQGVWKAGATYDWKNLNSEPTNAGRDEVLGKLKSWCNHPVTVVGHEAGVRPIIRNSRPVVGLHPEHQQIAFFNGLGSKGTLMAPAVAAHFADHLTDQCELDPELRIPFPKAAKSDYITTANLLRTTHELISKIVRAGDTVIDATVGNGHDTLFLTSLVGRAGQVIGFDVQEQAIISTRKRLDDAKVAAALHHCSHAEMLDSVGANMAGRIACVMFNLGYLPGADKSLITQVKSTLDALNQSVKLLKSGGVLTVMCYPGHAGGDEESEKVRLWMLALPDDQFQITHYRRENHRSGAPFLLVVVKK